MKDQLLYTVDHFPDMDKTIQNQVHSISNPSVTTDLEVACKCSN